MKTPTLAHERICLCKVCVLTERVQQVQLKLSSKDRAVIEELLNEWEHEGTEAGYYKAKFEKTWPK